MYELSQKAYEDLVQGNLPGLSLEQNSIYLTRDTVTAYIANITCSTAANTAAKIGSTSRYTLANNCYIYVMMVNANTYAGALTLNINSAGAKPIYINGSASSSSNYTLPAGSYLVYYSGTNYYFRTDGGIQGGSFFGNASTATKAI